MRQNSIFSLLDASTLGFVGSTAKQGGTAAVWWLGGRVYSSAPVSQWDFEMTNQTRGTSLERRGTSPIVTSQALSVTIQPPEPGPWQPGRGPSPATSVDPTEAHLHQQLSVLFYTSYSSLCGVTPL